MMDDSFQQLLDRYFDGAMDESALADLERELVSDREARAEFWRQAQMIEQLRGEGRESQGALLASLHTRPRRRKRWPWVAAAAALAAMATWGMLARQPRPETPWQPTAETPPNPKKPVWAVLERSASAVWKDHPGPQAGQGLGGDALVLSAGIATLQFISGARVLVSGPAAFTPVSGNSIHLERGVFELAIPEVASGFELSYPNGKLKTSGGNARVECGNGRLIEISVQKGSVSVFEDGAWRTLPEDSRVRPGSDGKLLAAPARANPPATLAERVSKTNTARLAEWRETSRRLDNDPSLLVHLRFDSPDEESSGLLVNSSSHPDASAEASVIAAQWVEGRWPGKRGLSFRNSVDRVRIEIRGSYPKATFCAWTRIDELPRYYNALFLSEPGIPGETHWQLSDSGEFRFGVRPRKSSSDGIFNRAFSGPILSDDRRGVWKHLATTYDAKTREVVHYADGQPIARIALDETVPLRFGAATIGNCPMPPPDPWGPRSFGGVIDEFLIYGRTLTATEIARLYQDGRRD